MRTAFLFFFIPIALLTKAQTKAIAVKGDLIRINEDGTWRWITLKDDGTWKFTDSLRTQHEIDSAREYESEVAHNQWNSRLSFNTRVGLWMPIGNLQKTFKPGCNFALWFGWPAQNGMRIDFGLSVSVYEKSKKFKYLLEDKAVVARSSAWFMLGIQVTREIEFKRRVIFDFLDIYSSTGLSAIDTNKKKPKNDKYDEDEYYNVKTLHLSTGLSLRRKISERKSLGLYVQYNFTPQRLFSRNVERGFGNSSWATGLVYQF